MKTQVYYRVQAVEAMPMEHKKAIARFGELVPDDGEDLGHGYIVNTASGLIWITADDFEEVTYESGKDAIVALKGLIKTTTTKEVQEKLDAALELYDERNCLGRRIYTIENLIELTGVPRKVLNKALKARKGV